MKHPALMKSSGWTYSQDYRELEAAASWGCPTPEAFKSLSKDDKLDILARYEVRWRIDAINSYEQMEEAKRNAKKPRRGRK